MKPLICMCDSCWKVGSGDAKLVLCCLRFRWSMGVVLFVMLFGFPPFYAETNAGIYKAIQKGFTPEVKKGYGAWFPEAMPVSPGARDCLSKLLESDISKRMTAEEALNHRMLLCCCCVADDIWSERHQWLTNLCSVLCRRN